MRLALPSRTGPSGPHPAPNRPAPERVTLAELAQILADCAAAEGIEQLIDRIERTR